ncbi:MAG: hypothetical protein ACFFCW_33455 [Candidatus Hodarchaeota archaeon]
MHNVELTNETMSEVGDKPISNTNSRIGLYFILGIIGIFLLIIAYSLLPILYSIRNFWSQFPSGIADPIISSLENWYSAAFFLKATGLLLGGFVFFGCWRVYSSRVFLGITAVTISLAGIMLGAFVLDYISVLLTAGIFSATYYVLFSDPIIGVIFLFWGSTYQSIQNHLRINSFSKLASRGLVFFGVFLIVQSPITNSVFPIFAIFWAMLTVVFPTGVDSYLVLQIILTLLIILTLVPAAVFLNQSKEFLMLEVVKEKPREFFDVEEITPKLSRLRIIGLAAIIIGFILCIPRLNSGAYFSLNSPINIIAFFLVALGLTFAGIAFVGYHLCSRSIISLVAGIISIFLGWFLLINEIIHGFSAVSYSGRWGIPMYASTGQTFVAYISFFLIGYALVGVIFIFRAVTIHSLRKPAYKLFLPVKAPTLYLLAGIIVLCSIPFVNIMLIQSIQLISEGVGFLSQHPPIFETLAISWIIFSIVIILGIYLEISGISQKETKFL